MRFCIALFCLGFIWQQGCQRSQSQKMDGLVISEIELSKTPCRGQCPTYLVRMNSSEVHLEAYAHLRMDGEHRIDMPVDLWKRLIDFLEKEKYSQIPEESFSGALDVSSSHWKIRKGPETKSISYDARSGHVFQALEKELEDWFDVALGNQ